VGVDLPSELITIAEQIRSQTTVPALLGVTARSFGELLNAPACTISRVIGDLLVDLIQHRRDGRGSDRLGHGYLLSDYPLTRAVIEEREPRTVFVGDPEADANETALLGKLGFDSLLMLALETEHGAWGLVEVYGESGRRFSDEQVSLAQQLADEVSSRLAELERPA
jgi:GAF domain-containing protein